MAVGNQERFSAEVESAIELAQLLERMERNPVAVNADQYRSIVQRLSNALPLLPEGEVLESLLSHFQAAAELYENLHYQHSGLSRSPLDDAVAAELAAVQALKQASGPATPAQA